MTNTTAELETYERYRAAGSYLPGERSALELRYLSRRRPRTPAPLADLAARYEKKHP